MSTLITAAVLLGLALWAVASYSRLLGLRREVTRRWREVQALRRQQSPFASEPDSPAAAPDAAAALEPAECLYNLAAAKYNLAINSPPGSLIAGLAGFKRAELLERYGAAGGTMMVCPLCFHAKQLDEAGLVSTARLGGTVQLWEWIGDGATTFSY